MSKEKLVSNYFGQNIFVDSHDCIGEEIIKKGLYDKSGVHFMRDLIQELDNPVVLDIGANIGNHLLPILAFVKEAIAFEPQPEIFDRLSRSIDKNGFTHCKLNRFGLGCEEEELLFYRNQAGNSGASSFIKGHFKEKQDTLTLSVKVGDQVVKELGIDRLDFIKMDVEGFEVNVIKGLKQTIQSYSPMIFMEWNSESTKKQFIEENIFDNYLSGYKALALVTPSDPILWKGSRFWKVKREVTKLVSSKNWRLTEFSPEENYSNILLYKEQHSKLIDGLYK